MPRPALSLSEPGTGSIPLIEVDCREMTLDEQGKDAGDLPIESFLLRPCCAFVTQYQEAHDVHHRSH